MRKEYKYIELRSKELCEMRANARALMKEFDALDFDYTEKKQQILKNYQALQGKMFLLMRNFTANTEKYFYRK